MKNYTSTSILKVYAYSLLYILLISIIVTINYPFKHSYNKKFRNYKSWSPTQPKDIRLKNFRPYRAVYNRTYIDSRGEVISDQVIMIAQEVCWYGKKGILFEHIDSGSLEFEKTVSRTQFYYLDATTLQLYLAVGPKLGSTLDYTTIRVLEDKISTSKLNTTTGKVAFSELVTEKSTFGLYQLRFLMWAAMDLNIGDEILLQPIFSPVQSNGIFNPTLVDNTMALGIVEGQVDYTTPDNKKYRPYVVENTRDLSSPIVNKFFIINEAPYLLAQGLYNADDDEIYRWWLKLDKFEYLK